MTMHLPNSLYAKLALALLLSFSIITITLVQLTERLSNNYQDEVRQKLHLELADHIAKSGDLIADGKVDETRLEQVFHNLMVLGPDFEFYLLDTKGKIIAYSADPGKLKREFVNLEPLEKFLSGKFMLPILGDDPRSLSNQKIFSVAAINDATDHTYYLYIIIGGEIYDDIVELLGASHIMQIGIWVLAGSLAFCLIVILFIFLMLTNPLRLLSRDINELRVSGFEGSNRSMTEWDENSTDEIQRIGVAFRELALKLESQYQKVKTTDELRKELLSYISHDIRTPLASLQGYLETWQIKQGQLDETASRKYIQVALENAQQISVLVEQLFELAHLDSSEVRINRESVAVAELAQDVLQQFRLIAEENHINLVVEPRDSSLLVYADIAKLERVLSNLVDNAIRHCRDGDVVTIRIQPTAADLITITVSDTGRGIDESDLPYIFSPHFKGKNPIRGKKTNSGLGLAITRRLLELHDTEIFVKSRPGEGSSFWFSLPSNHY